MMDNNTTNSNFLLNRLKEIDESARKLIDRDKIHQAIHKTSLVGTGLGFVTFAGVFIAASPALAPLAIASASVWVGSAIVVGINKEIGARNGEKLEAAMSQRKVMEHEIKSLNGPKAKVRIQSEVQAETQKGEKSSVGLVERATLAIAPSASISMAPITPPVAGNDAAPREIRTDVSQSVLAQAAALHTSFLKSTGDAYEQGQSEGLDQRATLRHT